MKKLVIISAAIGVFLVFLPIAVANAAEGVHFFIEKQYDISGRSELNTVLVQTTQRLYFYFDKSWWDAQSMARQQEIVLKLNALSLEFDGRIYPTLTTVFGSEWKPGIDGDERITVLFHQMREGAGGYFRSADEYLRLQSPDSNEREMLYLPIDQIDNPQLKGFLAHEFMHLITFNQKEKVFNVSEEVWLNEARAEYVSTLLGYDDQYEGSNLQRRVKLFLENPTDSVTEWLEQKYDYGSVNLFIHYLVDHYSVEVLVDSLHSKLVGIPSINEALKKNGFKEDFSQIFTNWTIALLVNDCSLGTQYCYLNQNLANLRLNPSLNFLPLVGQSSLSVTNVTKNWAGNWQKFIGGNGVLKFEFKASQGLNFKISYLLQDKQGHYQINFLPLDENGEGNVYITDFGTKQSALIIVPSLQSKITGFDGIEPTYPFTFTVSVVERTPEQEAALIKQLLAQIEVLKRQIAQVQAQLDAILARKATSCKMFTQTLLVGVNGQEVRCLQEFLKSQGSEMYPEGLVSGYFDGATKAAVVRFQEKYASEILLPVGLNQGSGIVGPKTREKINQMLGS